MVELTWRNILQPRIVSYYGEDQQKPVSAVPTCLDAWNQQCRDAGGGVGLAHGWHIIIAGATGHGKTLLALNLAAAALRNAHDVMYISLEMSQEQLQTRAYAILSDVPVRNLERGSFDPETWKTAQARLGKLRLNRNEQPLLTTNTGPIRNIHEITTQMEGMLEEERIRFFIIDYLQLARTGNTDEEIYRAVSEISGAVMAFAHQHQVVTIGLSQLNRSASANRTDSPIAQGLIGSSSLENDADQVVILDHTRYERDALTREIARTWLILAKNRHGGTGSIPIEWDYRTLRCREAQPDEETLWPGTKKR